MRKMKKVQGIFATLILCVVAIPNVFATTIDEVKSSGKLEIKSVPPKKITDAYMIGEMIGDMYPDYGLDFASCNEDYTECNLVNYIENDSTKVTITYVYDSVVKTVVDGIMSKVPEDGKVFHLNDVETIKYYIDVANYEPSKDEVYSEISPLKYSNEYNQFIGYKNFVFEPRMGFDNMFSLYRGGTASFTYNGTVYGFADRLGVRVNNILYVNDDETDITGALKTRLSKYFDIKEITEDEYTIDDIIADELSYYERQYDTCSALKEELDAVPLDERNNDEYGRNYSNYMMQCSSLMQYDSKEAYLDNIKENDFFDEREEIGLYNFHDKVLPNVYVITFEDDVMIPFFVIKDSSKVFDGDLEIITSDAASGIEVSTNGLIPLDTLIQVAKLTNGEEYDKIVKILNNKNVEMFDIKLFSKSASNFITKLDDGSFEVKLPINDNLKGKDLVVYYVNDDNSVETYKVTIDGDYAIFTTNHFSVYTLAEQSNSETENPKTGDNILLYVAFLGIGLTSLAVATYKKRIN